MGLPSTRCSSTAPRPRTSRRTAPTSTTPGPTGTRTSSSTSRKTSIREARAAPTTSIPSGFGTTIAIRGGRSSTRTANRCPTGPPSTWPSWKPARTKHAGAKRSGGSGMNFRGREMEYRESEIGFREADRRFAGTKRQLDAGSISEEEFDAQRRRLMVQDEEGRWWAKSRKGGEWNYHDGSAWVRDTPPS